MKTLFCIVFVLFATIVSAAPWLVCDPQAGVTSYNVTGQSFAPTVQPAIADGSIKMDLASAPSGETALLVSACFVDSIWGRYCSVSTPFTLTRPTVPPVPRLLRLAP